MIITKILARVKSILSSLLFFRDRKVKIKNGLTISTPPGHRLKEYQEVHPRYDKFLGELASVLPPQSVVIDVGANVGDSLALMGAYNPGLKFLCVEPDPNFMSYLAKNVQKLLSSEFKGEIEVSNSFVGHQKSGALVGGATTKAFERGAGGFTETFLTLGELGKSAKIRFKSPLVKFIKIDVDGYDWEVIDSGLDFIAEDSPIIFFEALVLNEEGRQGLKATVESLQALNYSFALFDNYGSFILESNLATVINQLISYTFRQEGKTASPIQYFDILAASDHEMREILGSLNFGSQ